MGDERRWGIAIGLLLMTASLAALPVVADHPEECKEDANGIVLICVKIEFTDNKLKGTHTITRLCATCSWTQAEGVDDTTFYGFLFNKGEQIDECGAEATSTDTEVQCTTESDTMGCDNIGDAYGRTESSSSFYVETDKHGCDEGDLVVAVS